MLCCPSQRAADILVQEEQQVPVSQVPGQEGGEIQTARREWNGGTGRRDGDTISWAQEQRKPPDIRAQGQLALDIQTPRRVTDPRSVGRWVKDTGLQGSSGIRLPPTDNQVKAQAVMANSSLDGTAGILRGSNVRIIKQDEVINMPTSQIQPGKNALTML